MSQQEKLLMMSTFLIGMTIGVYAYFAGFSGVDRQVSEVVERNTDSLVIIGEAYGGCDMAGVCPSFRVGEDGSYRYLYNPRGADEQVLREGQIPADLFAELEQLLTVGELQVASRPIEPAFCESFVDGIDVRYQVERGGAEYVLDSCGTDVDGEGRMWQTLGQIWTYFESIG